MAETKIYERSGMSEWRLIKWDIIPFMAAPTLVTKLFIPPARTDIVSRPRLLERLNARLGRKLTLISAPAGFGKTTLVSEWVNSIQSIPSPQKQVDYKIAWLSLDENDNDPTRFLAYFVSALVQAQGIDAEVGEGVSEMLQGTQTPPAKEILTVLINKIATLRAKLIIVMDDYHLIESAHVNDALAFLIEYLPPQIHLVLATREDPHLPLARFRARGEMNELRASDLRFLSDEITAFLQQKLGIQLSPDEITHLDGHTEGWITGLNLVAISLQGQENVRQAVRDVSGSQRFVLDYLLEEVLDQQSAEIQAFLIQTAILKQFTGALCDSINGQHNGQEILEYLEHANLFIVPLDQERLWYRYHHLFADFLRLRLRRLHVEGEPLLHIRASKWYEQNGFLDEAIEHALSARDFERVAHLISAHYETILKHGEYAKIWRWLDEIPIELLQTLPDLCTLNAWYLFSSGRLDDAELNLQVAEKHIQANSLENLENAKLRGLVSGVRAFIASFRGDIPGIIHYAHQALEELPLQEIAWRSMIAVVLGDAYGMAGDMNASYEARVSAFETSKSGGNLYFILLASMKLAVTFRMMGQLQSVIDICQEQFLMAEQKGLSQMAVVGWLLAIWGEALAETNEIDAGLAKARRGVAITDLGEDISMQGWSQICLIRVLFSHGDIDEAENIFRKLEELCHKTDMPPYVTVLASGLKARLLLARDMLTAANQWITTHNLTISGQITQLNEFQYLVFARILLAQGQTVEVNSLLQRLLEIAEARKRNSRMIEILIIQALAFESDEKTEQALMILERAIELAEYGGFVRIFVDEGPKMARLLYEAANCKIAPAYAQRILAAFPTPKPVQSLEAKSMRDGFPEFIEQLSDRELEVLHLIADGLSRQEISEELVLSLNTVKTHVRNIYGKLGVNNQMQAVGKARALGLLENE